MNGEAKHQNIRRWLLLKKVVVLFHYPETESHGQKIFEAKANYSLTVDNTQDRILLIREQRTDAQEPMGIIAVFKDWVYWEKLE